MPAEPLAGVRVLVTRPAGRARELIDHLVALGAGVDALPTIRQVAVPDSSAARDAVARIADYDWLVFTSAAGVEFFEALRAESGVTPSPELRVAAVGPATARAANASGLTVEQIAASASAERLADELRPLVRRSRVLWVRPERPAFPLDGALLAAGARVDAPVFYRTERAPEATIAAERLVAGRYAVALFSAPSTLRELLDAGDRNGLIDALNGARSVAIGQRTASALREAGVPDPLVAERPDVRSIVEAIRRAVGRV